MGWGERKEAGRVDSAAFDCELKMDSVPLGYGIGDG